MSCTRCISALRYKRTRCVGLWPSFPSHSRVEITGASSLEAPSPRRQAFLASENMTALSDDREYQLPRLWGCGFLCSLSTGST